MYSYISIKSFQMLRTSYSHDERERKNIGLFFNDYIYDKNKTMILRPLCIAARMENGEHASLTHCHSFQDFFKGIFSDFFSFRGTFLSSSLFSRLLHLARRCSLTALFCHPVYSNRIESNLRFIRIRKKCLWQSTIGSSNILASVCSSRLVSSSLV